jgi:hypothetical protein
MFSNRRTLLFLALGLALGAGALLALKGGPEPASVTLLPGPRASVSDDIPVVSRLPQSRNAEVLRAPEAVEQTEILYPLKVKLTLVEPANRLDTDGVGARGSGARARLEGHLFGVDGQGVSGEVRFTHGANTGRVLKCDAGGGFGANDLYPGLSIAKITGPLITGAEREVLLRNDRRSVLNIGFGRPAVVHGRVQDDAGDPISEAKVTMDGQVAYTDLKGAFYYPRMTSGQVLLFVEKDGFVAWRERYNVKAGAKITGDKLTYTMRPSARLELRIAEAIGGRQAAQVFLLPAPGARVSRDFPWHRINPVNVHPGGSTTVEGLPPGNLQLYLFHAGAKAKPRVSAVNLVVSKLTTKVLHLEPAATLKGRVLSDGEPVARALVKLEAPDQVKATLSTFGQPQGFLEVGVFPYLPTSVQSVWTDAAGRFELSANEEFIPTRYLTAESPDGKLWAGEVIHQGDREAELSLMERAPDECVLEFQMAGRGLALPVEVTVDGSPRMRLSLLKEEELRVDELARGRWKVDVRWNSQMLLRDVEVDLEDETALLISLPEAAQTGASALVNPARR